MQIGAAFHHNFYCPRPSPSESCPRSTLKPRAGRGFGPKSTENQNTTTKNTKTNTRKSSEQSVQEIAQQAAKSAHTKTKRSGTGVKPVDETQASKGKLDYVKVKDWGSGEPSDLGSLQVESFTPDLYSDHTRPFYEQLARRLEELQAKGLLNFAQDQQTKALPSFEKWSFSEKRYIQYIYDQLNVHYALEASIAEAIAVGANGPHSASEHKPSLHCLAAFHAAACFSEDAGLDRSRECSADLDSLAKVSKLESRVIKLKPTQQAAACAEYIARLGTQAAEEEEEAAREAAALRLVAIAYGLHVSHLTTGMRIGSAAGEKLNLFAASALNFYRTYKDVREPLQTFIGIVNEAGNFLTAKQQELVMDELPRAFPKISLLLTTLAHTD